MPKEKDLSTSPLRWPVRQRGFFLQCYVIISSDLNILKGVISYRCWHFKYESNYWKFLNKAFGWIDALFIRIQIGLSVAHWEVKLFFTDMDNNFGILYLSNSMQDQPKNRTLSWFLVKQVFIELALKYSYY